MGSGQNGPRTEWSIFILTYGLGLGLGMGLGMGLGIGLGVGLRIICTKFSMYKNFRVETCRKAVDHSVRGPFCPGTMVRDRGRVKDRMYQVIRVHKLSCTKLSKRCVQFSL